MNEAFLYFILLRTEITYYFTRFTKSAGHDRRLRLTCTPNFFNYSSRREMNTGSQREVKDQTDPKQHDGEWSRMKGQSLGGSFGNCQSVAANRGSWKENVKAPCSFLCVET